MTTLTTKEVVEATTLPEIAAAVFNAGIIRSSGSDRERRLTPNEDAPLTQLTGELGMKTDGIICHFGGGVKGRVAASSARALARIVATQARAASAEAATRPMFLSMTGPSRVYGVRRFGSGVLETRLGCNDCGSIRRAEPGLALGQCR